MNKKTIAQLAFIGVVVIVLAFVVLSGGDELTDAQRAARQAQAQQHTNVEQNQAIQSPQQATGKTAVPARRNISVRAEDLSSEIVVRAPNPSEALQHAELALSLRAQQMQTRRAALLAEQRKSELEALKHQTEFRRVRFTDEREQREQRQLDVLTGTGDGPALRVDKDTPMQPPALPTRERASLDSFRVVGIFKGSDGDWVARISRGGSIQRIKSDYILDGDINVSVFSDRVRLERGNETVELYL